MNNHDREQTRLRLKKIIEIINANIYTVLSSIRDFDEIIKDPELLTKLFDHELEDVRWAAMSFYGRHGSDQEILASACESALVLDNSIIVRRLSISILARYHKSTKNRDVCRLFAEIVTDENESEKIRGQAYIGIFKICGDSFRATPSISKLRIPEDIDWRRVRSYI